MQIPRPYKSLAINSFGLCVRISLDEVIAPTWFFRSARPTDFNDHIWTVKKLLTTLPLPCAINTQKGDYPLATLLEIMIENHSVLSFTMLTSIFVFL